MQRFVELYFYFIHTISFKKKDLTKTYLSTSCISEIDGWSPSVCTNNWAWNAEASICLQLSLGHYPAMDIDPSVMFDGHKINPRSTCSEPDGPVLNCFGLSSFFGNDNIPSHYILSGALSSSTWRTLRFSMVFYASNLWINFTQFISSSKDRLSNTDSSKSTSYMENFLKE